MLIVTGPKSRRALAAICDADLTLPWLSHADAQVAGRTCGAGAGVLCRANSGWEVHAPGGQHRPRSTMRSGRRGAEAVRHVGAEFLARRKGLPDWKGDLSTDYTLLEGGLDRFVQLDKPRTSPARRRLLAEKQRGVAKRFVTLDGRGRRMRTRRPCRRSGMTAGSSARRQRARGATASANPSRWACCGRICACRGPEGRGRDLRRAASGRRAGGRAALGPEERKDARMRRDRATRWRHGAGADPPVGQRADAAVVGAGADGDPELVRGACMTITSRPGATSSRSNTYCGHTGPAGAGRACDEWFMHCRSGGLCARRRQARAVRRGRCGSRQHRAAVRKLSAGGASAPCGGRREICRRWREQRAARCDLILCETVASVRTSWLRGCWKGPRRQACLGRMTVTTRMVRGLRVGEALADARMPPRTRRRRGRAANCSGA